MNPIERLVEECEASGVGRRVLLLRSTGAGTGTGTGPAVTALADTIARHARTRRHAQSPGLLALWWHGENPAWPGVLDDLPHGTRAELYDLPRDAERLLDALAPPPPTRAAHRGTPLDDQALAALERGLASADVARFMRRAPVLRHGGPDGRPRLAWEKRYLHLPEIVDTLAPGHDALADRLRLRLLCRTLDARMLRHLSDLHELASAGPFALNLNVASLSGPEFARFDAVLPARLRGAVVLVLSPDDVLADPAAFVQARDAARARRFRVMLRGVTAALLPVLALHRMEVDYVGLRWSRALDGATLRLGRAVPVLAGVDGPAALRWATRARVTLLAGRAASRASLDVPASAP